MIDVVLDGSTGKDDDGEKYINPVNILSQLNQDFYEKLEANTVQKRKEAIDMLESILSKAPKLESGEYGDLVRALKKVRNYFVHIANIYNLYYILHIVII